VVRALYVKGICDFGATYALAGDPRTASAVVVDLPDVQDKSDHLMDKRPGHPELLLGLLPSLPAGMQQKIVQE